MRGDEDADETGSRERRDNDNGWTLAPANGWIHPPLPASIACVAEWGITIQSGRPLSMVLQGTWSVRFSGCFESLRGRLGGGYPCRVLTSSALIAPGRRLFSAPTAGDLFYTFGDGSPTLHHSSVASLRVSLSAEVLASHQATSGHGQALNKHLALHGKRAAPSSSLWLARDGRCDSSQSKRVTVG